MVLVTVVTSAGVVVGVVSVVRVMVEVVGLHVEQSTGQSILKAFPTLVSSVQKST
jgi:hypothetical protein